MLKRSRACSQPIAFGINSNHQNVMNSSQKIHFLFKDVKDQLRLQSTLEKVSSIYLVILGLQQQQQMNLFIHLAVFVMLVTIPLTNTASTSWSQKFNRDFITGLFQIYSSDFSNSATTIIDMYFVNPFLSTIQTPSNVYYTTRKINSHTSSTKSPNDPLKTYIQYSIEKSDVGKSFLKSKISGYLNSTYFSRLCFNYLITLTNNRIFDTHIVIDTLTFTSSNPIYTPYPSKYILGDSIKVLTMLRDLKVEYVTNDQSLYNYVFQFNTQNYLQPNQTAKTALQVSPFFNSAGSDYSIRFLLLIIDQSRLNSDYYNYKSYTQVYSFTTSTSLPPNILNSLTTFITGISGLNYKNTYQPSFNFYINTNSGTSLSSNCNGNDCSFKFSYWATEYYDCDGPQWINNGTLCYDNCPSTQYFQYSNNTCQPCDPTCLTCYDATSCSSCLASQNRILNNVSCVPMAGFYQSGSPIAAACDTSCGTCSGGSTTDCTSCRNSSGLVNNTCQPCNFFYQGCAICNTSACFSCTPPYRHINQTYCNLPCNDPNCDVCQNANLSFCYACKPTSYRMLNNFGQCVPICGDGVVMDYEQCDDGNFDAHDGCSSQCKTEPHYSCTNLASAQGYVYTAYCSYLLGLNFSLVAQQKLQSSNSLRFILTVEQHRQSFWKSFQFFDGFISLSAKHSNLKANFISEWSFDNRLLLKSSEISPRMQGYLPQQYFQIMFQYHQELHNLPLTLSFAFSRSSDPRVNTIPLLHQTFTVLPENNQYAHLYLAQTYQQQSLIKKVILFECIALLVGYIIACFCRCKRIMAEAIMVAQIAFAGLVTVEWTNPLHSAIKSLSILFNPLNIFYSTSYRPFDDPLLPNRFRGMGLYSNLMSNLNTGLAFLLVPLLVGLILKLLSLLRCWDEQRKNKLSEYGKAWMTDFVFAGIQILGCGFGCTFALELQYAIKDIAYSGMVSIIISVIVSLLMLVYVIIWLKRSQLFAEYHQILNNKGPAQLIFSLVYSYSGLIIAFTSFMLFFYQHTTTIIVSCTALMLLFLQCKPVYVKTRDKIRVQINLLTIIVTSSTYLIDKFHHGYSHLSASSLFMAGTMIIPLALSINLVINLGFLTYQLVKSVRQWLAERAKKKMQNEEKNYMSQKSVEMKKLFQNNQDIPLKTINQVKFKNPLLETYEAEVDKDSANMILRDELNKFLELEKLQAQKVIHNLINSPRSNKPSPRLKNRKKYGQQMIRGQEYKVLGQL